MSIRPPLLKGGKASQGTDVCKGLSDEALGTGTLFLKSSSSYLRSFRRVNMLEQLMIIMLLGYIESARLC
jgi:hypothetical protein